MRTVISVVLALGLWVAAAGPAAAQDPPKLPTLDVVMGNNFGHLPMFVAWTRDSSSSDLAPLPADAR